MKIVIAGMGMVGYNLAKSLATENNDITCIDISADAATLAEDSLDVLSVQGNSASISVLKNAGADKANVFIAVCNKDEVNMISCLIAKRLGAKHTVARVREPEFTAEIELIKAELGIDLVINPEYATATQILRLLRFPNALDIEAFYRGRVELVGFRVHKDDFIAGQPLFNIQKKLGKSQILFCAVERGGQTIIPNGSTIIEESDKVYIIGDILGVNEFFKTLGRISQKIRNVMIVGGGRTAYYLTKLLTDMNKAVKIIDKDYERCKELCIQLPEALILNGDGIEQEVLVTENIDKTDCFVALTGDDEDNLIISLYAKQIGVPKVISKINRQDYYDVISRLDIDSFINPKLITAYTILHYIHGLQMGEGGKMEAIYQIAGGNADAVEFHLTDETKNLGKPLKELGSKLKKGILIVSILRNGQIIIPEGGTSLLSGDNVIIVSNHERILNINDIFND